MRTLLLALFGLVALSTAGTSPAQAQNYPWCAYYTGRDIEGVMSCGFNTLAQCQATISGIGGWCVQNPHYAYGQAPRDPRSSRRAPSRR